jgi:sugar lactone lactonase YvrE
MSMLQIECLGEQRDRLGECPLWDERRQALYWIDSKRCLVHRLSPDSGERRQWTLPSEIGSLALCESGRLLVALEHEIGFLDVDRDDGELAFEQLAHVKHPQARMRLNDGRADRAGRFLVGSLKLAPAEPVGELYQLLPSGQLNILERGIRVSNSLGFSPDGRTLYFADSLSHQIRRYSYDPVTGQASGMQVFADTTDLGSGPDGAAVDAEGHLWVAMVMKGQLARFRPDGSLERLLDLPTPYPSCLCFGGAALDTLFVTSLSDTGNTIKTDDPRAGRLLAVRGTGVQGLHEARFADLT